MTDDLIEFLRFLRAMLDKDEQKARASRPRPDDSTAGHWVAYPHRPTSPADDPTRDVHLVGCQEPDGREWVVAETGQADRAPAIAAHIALHDPARVLRDVEAKRRLLELHRPVMLRRRVGDQMADVAACAYDTDPDGMGWIDFPCTTLRLLALPYADHPDYREE